MKESEHTKKESKYTKLDYIVWLFTVLLIISNVILSICFPDLMNPLASLSFQLISLIFSVYIAYRVASMNILNQTIKLQKNTAKTAIRHIRGYQSTIQGLIEIIKEKIERAGSKQTKETLIDINNHLKFLRTGIVLSESDFKDILGEEFKEEHLLLIKLNNDLEKTNKKNEQIENLRKEEKTEDKERIKKLAEEIEELKSNISKSLVDMPLMSSPSIAYTNPEFLSISNISDIWQDLGESVQEHLSGIGDLKITTDTKKKK